MFGVGELTDGAVRAASEGAQTELGRVLEAMYHQVRLMVVARLSPAPARLGTVEEVTQQVMVALAAGIWRLENRTVVGLKAYASGIVVHKVSDALGGRIGGKADPGLVSLDSTVTSLSQAGPLWQFLSVSGTTPPSAAERSEQAARLIHELGRLKREHREVITLAFFDQVPMSEISGRMSISRPAASMLLIRAVQALRRAMTGVVQKEGAVGT
jgi:RNA polymerase sigma factor (sigma-70 family)